MKGIRRAILASLLGLLPTVGCGPKVEKSAGANTAPKPVTVTTADVEVRAVERAIDAVGTLKGWDQVTIGAKKFGRVAKVRHDIGDRVHPGEILVEFETVDADLAVNQAEKRLLAELAKVGVILDRLPTKAPTEKDVDVFKLPSVIQTQVTLERARQNLAREKNLMTKGAGTKQDLQNTENDVRNAEAAMDNAVLSARSIVVSALAAWVGVEVVVQARKDMEIRAPQPSKPPFGLKAPLSYAVSNKAVSEGQMIKEGDAVFDLVIENPLRLWVNVPERFVAEVKAGQEVRVEVGSYPGQVFPGVVSRINPIVDSSNRMFQVQVAVPNDEGKLRPGGFAKAQIITERNAQAVIVPLDAIIRFAGVTKLFVVGDDQKAHAVPVQTGKEGPGWVELLGPLPEKARVVTTGHSQLAEGTPVVVRVPEPRAKTEAEAEVDRKAKAASPETPASGH